MNTKIAEQHLNKELHNKEFESREVIRFLTTYFSQQLENDYVEVIEEHSNTHSSGIQAIQYNILVDDPELKGQIQLAKLSYVKVFGRIDGTTIRIYNIMKLNRNLHFTYRELMDDYYYKYTEAIGVNFDRASLKDMLDLIYYANSLEQNIVIDNVSSVVDVFNLFDITAEDITSIITFTLSLVRYAHNSNRFKTVIEAINEATTEFYDEHKENRIDYEDEDIQVELKQAFIKLFQLPKEYIEVLGIDKGLAQQVIDMYQDSKERDYWD